MCYRHVKFKYVLCLVFLRGRLAVINNPFILDRAMAMTSRTLHAAHKATQTSDFTMKDFYHTSIPISLFLTRLVEKKKGSLRFTAII